jgi:hypothetical protein
MSSGNAEISFKKNAKTTAKSLPKACRVYIPLIHSDRALPKSIISPSKKDLSTMEAMFPVFIAQTEDLSKKPLHPGDRLIVKIKNNLGGGIYTNRTESSFSISSFKGKGGKAAAAAFRCNIIKSSKVLPANATSIAGNVTITTGGTPPNPFELSEAAMTQQYIKYLYEREKDNITALKSYWTKEKLKGAIEYWASGEDSTVFKNDKGIYFFTDKAKVDQTIDKYKKLTWFLLYQTSGFVPAGLSVGGNIVISASAVEDYYGMFRATKKHFETSKENLPSDFEFFLNDMEHYDLLEPSNAIKFFLIDFFNHLENKSQIKLQDYTLNEIIADKKIKKIIVNYFTSNDKRIDTIFVNESYDAILSDYDNVKSQTSDEQEIEFLSFEDWMTLSMTGAPASSVSMIEPVPPTPTGSQGPTTNTPPSTPDECHSNYPPYSAAAIHVNAQKKMVRNFIDSGVSGQDLAFLASSHKGVNNIKFAELKIDCPFKVVRYDGDSGYKSDDKRWFDRENKGNFIIQKERWGLGYYRTRNQITHVTVQSLGNNLSNNDFLKDTIHTMVSFNKKIPHFVVMENGQIIQLVDASCAIDYNSPVKLFSVNIAFGFGPGHMIPIESTEPTVAKPNCVLIKNDNIYSCHKLGTKAALQSMQKLIKFLTTITKIKYNLAAFDRKMKTNEYNKSTIQSMAQFKGGVSGMNFIYYAWTYNLAFDNGGKNVLSEGIYGG